MSPIVFFYLLLVVQNPPQEIQPQNTGIQVTSIRHDSTLLTAGLQVGDILQTWKRLPNPPANPQPAFGSFETPFHWDWLIFEEAPRGTVLLYGLRDGKPLTVETPIGLWKAELKPVFSPVMEQAWQTAQSLVKNGKIDEGKTSFEELMAGAEPALSCWFSLELGSLLLQKGKARQALDVYESALTKSAHFPEAQILFSLKQGKQYSRMSLFENASTAFQRLTHIWAEHWGEGMGYASGLHHQANIFLEKKMPDEAEALFKEVLKIRQAEAPNSLVVGHTFNNLGIVADQRNDIPLAMNYFNKALAIQARLAPRSLGVAFFSNNLGSLARETGQMDLARKYFMEALTLERSIDPGKMHMAITLDNLGRLSMEQGDFEEAEHYFSQALGIRKKLAPESMPVAYSYNQLGFLSDIQGKSEEAEKAYRKALSIAQKRAPKSLATAGYLISLGNLFHERGNRDLAKDYCLQALAIQETRWPESLHIAATFNTLALIAQSNGNLEEAQRRHEQALTIKRSLVPGALNLAVSLNNLGRLTLEKGELDKAELLFKEALSIQEKHGPSSFRVANSLDPLARIALKQGELEDAEAYLVRSHKIRSELNPNSLEMAINLNLQGKLSHARNEASQAISFYERAVTVFEAQLQTLGGSQNSRVSYLAMFEDFYDDYLATLLENDRNTDAFYVLERSRARIFLEMLAEREMKTNGAASKPLAQKRARLARLYEQSQKELWELPERKSQKEDFIRNKMRVLRSRYDEVGRQIKDSSPRLANLYEPQPLDFEAARKTLDPGTVMLSYWTTEKQSWLFVLKRGEDLKTFLLGKGSIQLGEQVKDLRSLLASPPGKEPLARRMLDMMSSSLFNTLITPAISQLKGAKKVVIVADGPLSTLPFHLLKGAWDRGEEERYLVEWTPLTHVVSATVFSELKSRPSSGATQKLAVFGDPIYPQQDDSFTDTPTSTANLRSILKVRDLKPLPYSAKEASAIQEIFGEQARIYVREQATETRAKSLGSEPDIIHFASHGYFNRETPLDSALLLSMPETGPIEGDNGVLQAWEIMESMHLDANLVVLSACDTGMGEVLGGEGLIGLTRAFQYAGARSVLASLWTVSDAAASHLMKLFYGFLKEGASPDEALQKAQIMLLHESFPVETSHGKVARVTFSHPYYWAAFHLIGSPR